MANIFFMFIVAIIGTFIGLKIARAIDYLHDRWWHRDIRDKNYYKKERNN